MGNRGKLNAESLLEYSPLEARRFSCFSQNFKASVADFMSPTMFSSRLFCLLVGVSSLVLAYDPQLGFNTRIEVETRSPDQIYQAALKEGGAITVWHGGDESNQQNNLKSDFEARFPGMTMNITVDLSKYHDGNIDRQLATGDVYVDSVILQTVHDYPRWKQEDALLYYKPLGFESQSMLRR